MNSSDPRHQENFCLDISTLGFVMVKISPFEQFSKNFVLFLVTVTLFFGVLEGISYGVLRIMGVNPYHYNYLHMISGYQVFKTTPGSMLWGEVKQNPNDPPTIIDANGFFSNNPITLQKPKDTFRIVIMGGSAAFGTGQFPPYSKVHPYRKGTLSYTLGPAGQLEAFLQAKRPDMKFEVINGSAVDRTLHQSLIYYLETVSRFSPDMVINLDGYNDLFYGLMTGRPYAEIESRLGHYINLSNQANAYKPSLTHLLTFFYNQYFARFVSDNLKEKFFLSEDMDKEKYSEFAYEKQEPSFIQTSQRFLQILEHYMAVLKSDNVDLIFTLQPILYRQVNKQWSPIEDRMRRTVFSVAKDAGEGVITRFILMSKYFFDNHLSKVSRERVEREGFGFMDLNEEIRSLKSDFELYVDYCHFTVPGSLKVAEMIGGEVLNRLKIKQSK